MAGSLDHPHPQEEFLAGSREVAPVLVGTIPFGFVAGVARGRRGHDRAAGHRAVGALVLGHRAADRLAADRGRLAGDRDRGRGFRGEPALPHVQRGTFPAPRAPAARMAPGLLSYVMTDQSFATAVRHFSEPGDAATATGTSSARRPRST